MKQLIEAALRKLRPFERGHDARVALAHDVASYIMQGQTNYTTSDPDTTRLFALESERQEREALKRLAIRVRRELFMQGAGRYIIGTELIDDGAHGQLTLWVSAARLELEKVQHRAPHPRAARAGRTYPPRYTPR